MLDLAFVRANLPLVEQKLRDRNMDPAAVLGDFAAVDQRRRTEITLHEGLRAEQKRVSEQIALAKRKGEETSALVEESLSLKAQIAKALGDLLEIETASRELMEGIPNLPQSDVPVGDERANRTVKVWDAVDRILPDGSPDLAYTPAALAFPPLDHVALGERLGILDFERAAKISGSRFVVHYGQGARLERALANFMLDLHTRQHGYTEVLPPYMVNSKSLFGTGSLPKFAADLFHCDDRPYEPGVYQDSDHWLIPTAEVPVTNLFRDETLDESQLTASFCAYTPCFRSEAGSYGKDVRGMVRQHQFQKVELVKFTTPDRSNEEHERLTRDAERVLELLGLPYRRVLLATGDMGFSSSKTYDLEVWLPGQQLYREISSCSNFEAFQARRANIRYRPSGKFKSPLLNPPKEKQKSEFVHTLNGSGLAVGRTYVAILENYQQPDGSIRIPEALVPYMNGEPLITKRG